MRKSIAVVDDDGIYKIIIGKMIRNSGLFDKIYLFEDPREALKVLFDGDISPPEIILLDLNMPHLDGWEFLEYLKANQPKAYRDVEIYIVTSSISNSDKERAKSYEGVQGFISKPISLEFLRELGA